MTDRPLRRAGAGQAITRAVTLASALAAAAATATPAGAATLQESAQEWAFAASWVGDGDHYFASVDFEWQWISPAGRHEIGALVSYAAAPPPGRAGEDEDDALLLGPVYTWNWTPRFDRATGFLELSAGEITGDLSDDYERTAYGALGAKLFLGDSAAVTVRLFRRVLTAQREEDDDRTATGIAIGLSLFTSHRPALGP